LKTFDLSITVIYISTSDKEDNYTMQIHCRNSDFWWES